MLDITISATVTDEKWFNSTLKALIYSAQQFKTKKVQLISFKPFSHDIVEYVPLKHKISSLDDWNLFHVKYYHLYVTTKFVLNIHDDGFIINPNAWNNQYLEYDYIGALWGLEDYYNRCGNGGFSLRSKRFLETVSQNCEYISGYPEDLLVCRYYKQKLSSLGITFASNQDAVNFSIENTNIPENHGQSHYNRFSLTSFGFHWRNSDAIKFLEKVTI